MVEAPGLFDAAFESPGELGTPVRDEHLGRPEIPHPGLKEHCPHHGHHLVVRPVAEHVQPGGAAPGESE
eukprot:9718255-Lingulodinium_polyedra.AAC.1